MSWLRCLCLFTCGGVVHIVLWFCFVFLRLVYPVLPVSLDCPYLIVPSVFSKVYSLRRDVLAHKTSLTPPLLIEMPVLIQESERWSCICVLEVMYLCIVGIYFAPFYDFDT